MKNHKGKLAVFFIIIFTLLAAGVGYLLLDIYTPDENSHAVEIRIS
ncbi:hypothetical protein H8S33_06440 [Ornithinibacillus sp. BX22]|uniref:Uncharacterized protein n=2 Tax=Ornithinibacillus TaxID=484508 RepID=A0A923L4T1_9BACI|nr:MULTISPECIES: hypothetical protein [Ornithinibacillus]MBC5636462.1 hypothetical protein [Ornithinibacillus hominis]MBS3680697.1 hypothetical protein [Ornithinibacillus massiliensis]